MSNETKWTPGPWYAFIRRNTKIFAVFGPDCDPGNPVVEWTGFDPSVFNLGHETVEANTKLIATAPDLYDALAKLVHLAEQVQYDHNTCAGDIALDEARAILAKARGEQP